MSNYCGEDPCYGNHRGDCKEAIDSRCVFYNLNGETPSQLMCFLNIENQTSVHDILEKLDSKLCDLFNITLLPCFRDLIGLSPTESLSVSEFLYKLQQYICNSSDEKVKVSANDPQAGYLYDKITVDDCLERTVKIDGDGKRSVHISVNWECAANKIQPFLTIPNCYEIDCVPCENSGTCTPKPLIPVIIKTVDEIGNAVLSCTSCNGIITWYNEDDEVVGYGTSTIVTGGTFYAKSETVCGTSEASNSIVVPPYTIYTYTKTTSFTRNNCPDNGCGLPCIGTTVLFSKTYTSYISQAHAQQLANTDTTYSTQGQNYANLNGACDCPSCDCIRPLAPNFVVNNPTCNGLILQSNGSVSVTNISNATKFGISYSQGGYTGPNYDASYSMGYTSSNISSTINSISLTSLSTPRIVLRVFNGENSCYTDLLFTLTLPQCNSGDGSVDLGNVSVSCEIP